MTFHPKPLSAQTIVITGASSGIGLATARRAALAGARVILVARNQAVLETIVRDLNRKGAAASFVAGDIAEPDTSRQAARMAFEQSGGIDSWVNAAAAGIYACLRDTPIEDHRRLFDVGYFGMVQASQIAVDAMRDRGGTLINIGSTLSERAVAIQGAYSAMKHAVKGYTDALRTELIADRAAVQVTLIKPHGIDTPWPEHARNLTGRPARIPPIVYDPALVADAICFAATHRRRELTVGGVGSLAVWADRIWPAGVDRVIALAAGPTQTTTTPPAPGASDNLYAARADGRILSNQNIDARRSSMALSVQKLPRGSLFAVAALAVALGIGWTRKNAAATSSG
ncbi:SDR family oxidoreductase [Sphingomonas sp.]|uniref:SDR family oxidoreductase n=1 Tax=Sphingomonas sp. TaxID=28214 RepID=UPI002CD6BE91|nr:SDR family oxidoreductase [Sphingomonas sp.]HTG38943.1 SDR family oxidoreductase [Sphingomonas sp.]